MSSTISRETYGFPYDPFPQLSYYGCISLEAECQQKEGS